MATVTFGSFPRSGNFFLVETFRKNASSVGVNWVGHNAYLLTKHKDSFTIIRNPLDCVPSWIVYKKDVRPNRAEKVLEWYCAYYEKCFDNKIKMFTFDYLINNPIGLISQFCEVQIYDTNFKYFYNETKDKSGYNEIIEEMQLAPSYPRAIKLFQELSNISQGTASL